MHGELYNFFRTSFSAQQFRRWVRQLDPDGATLAQALPDGDVNALTLFDVGADLLIRNNYVDAALFVALVREFPLKAEEVAGLAARCKVRPAPPQITTEHFPPVAAYVVGLVAVLGLAAVLAQHMWTPAPVEPPQPVASSMQANIHPSPTVPPAADPTITTGAVAPIGPEPDIAKNTSSDTRTATTGPSKKSVNRKDTSARQTADGPLTPTTPPPAPCKISDAVQGDLGALARTLLTSEGVTEEFVVTLHDGAAAPEVSKAPGPGESVRKQMYTRLKALGPAELGRCRDIPIDVEFTKSKTTLSPRLH